MPSAMPRNSDSEPSVTISGGRFSLVISTAFSSPATHPNTSAAPAAAGIGQPPSRHSTPNTTAESPMMEPTDKSIPPVIMIGVIASASKPSSTLNRTTSKKFDSVKKFSPIAGEDRQFHRQRKRQHPLPVREADLAPRPTLVEH